MLLLLLLLLHVRPALLLLWGAAGGRVGSAPLYGDATVSFRDAVSPSRQPLRTRPRRHGPLSGVISLRRHGSRSRGGSFGTGGGAMGSGRGRPRGVSAHTPRDAPYTTAAAAAAAAAAASSRRCRRSSTTSANAAPPLLFRRPAFPSSARARVTPSSSSMSRRKLPLEDALALRRVAPTVQQRAQRGHDETAELHDAERARPLLAAKVHLAAVVQRQG